MKLWMKEEITPTYRNVRFNGEEHSDFSYLGDLDDEAMKTLFKEINPKLDLEKNLKMIKYFGYLHLFVIIKS